MIRIRVMGRGGQGAKTLAEILGSMLCDVNGMNGKFPFMTAAPEFGPERRGAPVNAYIRLDRTEIRELGRFEDPDMVIVFDETLAKTTSITAGLKEGGVLLINSQQDPSVWRSHAERFRTYVVDADAVAKKHGLGTRATPIVNTALLGAFVRASGLSRLDVLLEFIAQDVRKKTDENKLAATDAFNLVTKVEAVK